MIGLTRPSGTPNAAGTPSSKFIKMLCYVTCVHDPLLARSLVSDRRID